MASTYLSGITAAVADRFVASANMKVGAYTVANASAAVAGGRRITVTHTTVAGADTLGTIVVVGKDLFGNSISETITPLAGTIATGTRIFISITSVTGVGWVATSTEDTITVGHSAPAYLAQGGGTLGSVTVGTTAAGAITVADARGTMAVLKSSIVEGTYRFDTSWTGWLEVTVVAASTVTVVHSVGTPSSYAMA